MLIDVQQYIVTHYVVFVLYNNCVWIFIAYIIIYSTYIYVHYYKRVLSLTTIQLLNPENIAVIRYELCITHRLYIYEYLHNTVRIIRKVATSRYDITPTLIYYTYTIATSYFENCTFTPNFRLLVEIIGCKCLRSIIRLEFELKADHGCCQVIGIPTRKR